MTFFDSTEFLIGIQVLVFLLLVIGLLALLMRRQKKIIQELQSILTEYRDDISGDTMRTHLKREIDNTTAHCRQDTIALKQDLSPEDMDISLRYSALQAELALMQEDNGAKQHWRDQIKAYEELAHALHEIIRSRVEYGNRILKDAHVDELAAKYVGKALVAKVNTDHSQRAAAPFNIRGIPTSIVFKGGKPVIQKAGAMPLAGLEELLKPVL